MTKKDKKLIEKARRLSSIDWDVAHSLSLQADTHEAVNELKRISRRLYHREEYDAGVL